MNEIQYMEAEFAASIKALPGVQAGVSNTNNLLAICRNTGRNKEAVLTAAGAAIRQAKAYPDGHPSREMAFDLADTLYFYHDHLEEVERYEGELAASKEQPRFLVV